MSQEQIANRQLWFILFIMRMSAVLAFLPVLTTADALQDAWISVLVVLVGSEIIVLLVAMLCAKFPELTLIEYSQVLLGNWLGKILGLAFLALFLQLSVVELRLYGELLMTGFLPQTPLLFIAVGMVLPATICVQQGVEVLGRVADLLFIVFVIAILIALFLTGTEIELTNLQPVLARGWGPVLRGAVVPIVFIVQIWVLGMLAPVTAEPEKSIQVALTSIAASLFTLLLIVLTTIAVLSPQEGARVNFPFMVLMRAVRVSKFIERIEILVIFSWGFGVFISLSTFLYAGAKGMAQWLGLEDYRSIIWPMAVLWVFLTVHGFDSIFEVYSFLKPSIVGPYGAAYLLGPLVLLWSAYGVRTIVNKVRKEN
ncbi:spore germination protein [Natroniella sulfidigena]|uniref:GerAB/ArcD/ProY family transporter n=1 Tax=Natroniella sulfidigena TaxID=723921 RepID=UPI00200A2410|nr:endospore germination permease [Natroniella sulfidigena]MCK8817893.1 spore germination protein [Natroniella sulfidigena]